MKADVMLCDFAQVHQGKLFVSGGSINLIGTPSAAPPHPISVWVAGLITVPWTQTNRMHHLVVAVDDADGTRVHLTEPAPGAAIPESEVGAYTADFNVGRAPIMQAGEETLMPFVFPIGGNFPTLGSHVITVSVDGTELGRLTFRILGPQPGGMFPM
jgi:hypothetical protein